jgi:hypothetical protein
MKEGAELSAEDLEQIPPSPKPYVQADKQQLEQPESSSQAQLTEKPIEKRQDDIQIGNLYFYIKINTHLRFI